MKARAIKFYKALDKLLMDLGATKEEYICNQYIYKLDTKAGGLELYVDKWDGEYEKDQLISVHSRFLDVAKMNEVRKDIYLDANEYSGKWNHYWDNKPYFDHSGTLAWWSYIMQLLKAKSPIPVTILN